MILKKNNYFESYTNFKRGLFKSKIYAKERLQAAAFEKFYFGESTVFPQSGNKCG